MAFNVNIFAIIFLRSFFPEILRFNFQSKHSKLTIANPVLISFVIVDFTDFHSFSTEKYEYHSTRVIEFLMRNFK